MVRTRVSMRQSAIWYVELGAGTFLAQGKRIHGAYSRPLGKVRFFPSSLNTPLSCVQGRLCLKPHSVKLWSPARFPLLEPPDLHGLRETKVLLSLWGRIPLPPRYLYPSPKLRTLIPTPLSRVAAGYGGGNYKAVC